MSNENPKVQINKSVKWGTNPKTGKTVNETSLLFNVRCDDVDEAVDLYQQLIKRYYAAEQTRKAEENKK